MSANFRINPARLVAEVVEGLSPRLKGMIVLRFGLEDGKRRTLEAIGQKYSITRERVRQIQNDAYKYLTKDVIISKVKPLFETLQEHLEEYGGVRKEATLFESDLVSSGTIDLSKPQQRAAIYFALNLSPAFERHLETDLWHTYWSSRRNAPQLVKRVASALVDNFEKKGITFKEDEVRELVDKILTKQRQFKGLVPEKVINAYFGLVRPVAKNIYGEFGLRSWPQINPVGVRDKANLVFQKLKKPMHFTEVAKAINAAGFSKRLAHPQTVHNELIKDPRFVLIGRGIYALKEWGYMPGTVKDVLIDILKKNSRPLNKEEIMVEIAKQRMVKPNTVALNLQNKNYYKRTLEGRYTIA